VQLGLSVETETQGCGQTSIVFTRGFGLSRRWRGVSKLGLPSQRCLNVSEVSISRWDCVGVVMLVGIVIHLWSGQPSSSSASVCLHTTWIRSLYLHAPHVEVSDPRTKSAEVFGCVERLEVLAEA
jgi:hypothetical protein